MKNLFILPFMVCNILMSFAQNVGVGTLTPQEKLHVAGNMRVGNDLITYQNGVILDSLVVGNFAGAPNARVRVAGGKTRTDALTVGGPGFLNKMFSVYGDGQISGNTLLSSLNVTGDGIVAGNFRMNGRIGINGATNAAYGFMVNNAHSFFQGDAHVSGNKRINGRAGINGATNAAYGLMLNNAHAYFQGSATVSNDAVVNGNTRIDGRIGINGPTHLSYGLMVNNAHSYYQGNLTVTGNLNVLGTSNLSPGGTVLSNGTSSIKIGYIQYHINKVLFGNEDSYDTFTLPEFGPNVDDIRVSVFQYIDSYNDPMYSNPKDFRWWISDINPENNTARIRTRNLAVSGRALRGDFFILVLIRD